MRNITGGLLTLFCREQENHNRIQKEEKMHQYHLVCSCVSGLIRTTCPHKDKKEEILQEEDMWLLFAF